MDFEGRSRLIYTVAISRAAQKAINQLQPTDGRRMITAIAALAQNPRPPGSIKLTGRAAWRIRVGNYRIVYDIDDDKIVVTIVAVGHRRDTYRS